MIYIHIPFCASRCIYCGFYSTAGMLSVQDEYVDAVLEEYALRKDYLTGASKSTGGMTYETAYIGGGTPSLLSHRNLLRLGEMLVKDKALHEFTVECNPDDVTPGLALTLARMGVDRVSMGAQTFSDSRLAWLHRRHHARQIPTAIETLRNAGIDNISLDLMFGFPDETLSEWCDDIQHALRMQVEHISAYSLMYEEGTALYSMLQRGEVDDLPEVDCAAMYYTLVDMLTHAGYEHYEISNFALPGHRSKHNSQYWDGTPYLGLGAGAHSYDGRSRQWNVADLQGYIRSINAGRVPCEREELDGITRYNDMITTALRTKEGLSMRRLTNDERAYILREAEGCIQAGTLQITDDRIRLTRRGLYISDDVMSQLIMV